MNIRRAKEEIIHTIQAYRMKDAQGAYLIPPMQQRPVFLIGAPGIGKTQIMEQIARECGIGLVSYTITHHTRQSAIGLPYIQKRVFGEKEYSFTEYTMSEIIASIYEKMEQTGLREGILFLDEINCVSETLAPAMLQFLQYKTFGSHKVPDGWVIVTAGNPPEYNKSVRAFDVVTMDRVKKIVVEPDYRAWKAYAQQEEIHPAVRSYLEARQAYFYRMETTVDGQSFVTPRGWEDLSRLMNAYEGLGLPVDREVTVQYLQHEKIAKDFANYLELFRKYQMDGKLEDVLNGIMDEALIRKAGHASFDEKLGIVSLLLSRLGHMFRELFRNDSVLERIHKALQEQKEEMEHADDFPALTCSQNMVRAMAEAYELGKKSETLTKEQDTVWKNALHAMEEQLQQIRMLDSASEERNARPVFEIWREWFDGLQDKQEADFGHAAQMLEYSFDFMEAAFANGQEMVIFVTELNTNPYCVRFLQEYDCERYYYYNKNLLFEENVRGIEERLRELPLT